MSAKPYTDAEIAYRRESIWSNDHDTPIAVQRLLATIAARDATLAQLRATMDAGIDSMNANAVRLGERCLAAEEELARLRSAVPADVAGLVKRLHGIGYMSSTAIDAADALESLAREVAELTQRCAEAEKWRDDDAPDDEWSADIHAAHPVRSGAHDSYGVAMRMVGNRRSKGALVALVNWLLVRIESQARKLEYLGRSLVTATEACEGERAARFEQAAEWREKSESQARELAAKDAKAAVLHRSIVRYEQYWGGLEHCKDCPAGCEACHVLKVIGDVAPATSALLARIEALTTLATYAVHTEMCSGGSFTGTGSEPCDCGAQEAFDALAKLDAAGGKERT